MNFALLRRMCLLVVLGCFTVSTTGCSKSPSGVYTDDTNTFSVDFKSGGKATVTIGGSPMEGDYTVDGKTVTVKVSGDAKVFTLNDDGSLAAPGTTLKKK